MKHIKLHPPCQYPTVFMGSYEMPNASKPPDIPAKAPIEWLVLEMNPQERKVLLLSKYALDWESFAEGPYIASRIKTSWAESYLRTWLNGNFLQNCFDAEERSAILSVFIPAESRRGKRTMDQVFLLSAAEVKKYFPHNTAATFEPMIGCSYDDRNEDAIELWYEPCFWWTRTPGKEDYLVKCVDPGGNLCELDSNAGETGVRPAMWLKL